MSFIEPNFGQTQHNKKILQELEEKKRRMRIGSGFHLFPLTLTKFPTPTHI